MSVGSNANPRLITERNSPSSLGGATHENHRPVDVQFDCLPLRSVTRLDPPLDASPGLVAKWNRIKAAILAHGTHNAYYLHNATCRFFVTNNPDRGMIAFKFEGVLFTDSSDSRAVSANLQVDLALENVSWLEQHVVK